MMQDIKLKKNEAYPLAIISECEKYRYFLSRSWIGHGKKICFIGLNPSTADASFDDPTIRRCVDFSKRFDGSHLLMVNIFAYRSTNPKFLEDIDDPFGEKNSYWIDYALSEADIIISAWGNNKLAATHARAIVPEKFHQILNCLDYNKNNSPKHPLYVKKDTELKKFNF